MKLEKKLVLNQEVVEASNLTDRFSDEDLGKIGDLCALGYERDKRSRAVWERRMESAMDLAMQVQKEKNFPWPGASNVIFPLVTIAALQFSARSYTNLVQGTDIVRYRVAGEDSDGKLRDQGDRISKHMSWQVLEEDMSWEEQHDRLLINLGIVGTNFIKSYWNSTLGHTVSELVMARDFVLDYHAKSVESCARKSQLIRLYRNEVYERVRRGMFRDVLNDDWFMQQPRPESVDRVDQRSGNSPDTGDEDTPFRAIEQHRTLDLDQDGYAEPYIVTFEQDSRRVLRIVSRVNSMDDVEKTTDGKVISVKPTEYFTKYSFIPSPDGGIYDLGFGLLLGPLNEAVNSGINQLLDSGTMQNSMGGFLGRGAKIRGGVYTMAPWEWKRVDSTGDDLRKNLVPYPERNPSTVMFQLLSLLIDYVDRLAGSTEVMVGKNPGQNTPAESYRSMLEQGSQVYNMVFKRVWRSMKEEFKKRHGLNAVYMKEEKLFGSNSFKVYRADYLNNPDLVVPSADPNVTSSAQRMTQAQAIRQAAKESAGYDIAEVEKNFLRAMRVEGIDKFYPGPEKVPSPKDPRLQLEEVKQQGKALELQHDKQQFILEMLETRRLNDAKVLQLTAQAESLTAGIDTEAARFRLDALTMAVDALHSHNELINKRLEIAQGNSNGGSSSDNGSGAAGSGRAGPRGLPKLEDAAHNTGILEALGPMADGANGGMGAG